MWPKPLSTLQDALQFLQFCHKWCSALSILILTLIEFAFFGQIHLSRESEWARKCVIDSGKERGKDRYTAQESLSCQESVFWNAEHVKSPRELLLQQSLIKETLALKQGYTASPHTHAQHQHQRFTLTETDPHAELALNKSNWNLREQNKCGASGGINPPCILDCVNSVEIAYAVSCVPF